MSKVEKDIVALKIHGKKQTVCFFSSELDRYIAFDNGDRLVAGFKNVAAVLIYGNSSAKIRKSRERLFGGRFQNIAVDLRFQNHADLHRINIALLDLIKRIGIEIILSHINALLFI